MSRLDKFTVIVACLWFLAATTFFAHPHVATQLLTMLLTPALLGFGLANLVLVLRRWFQMHLRNVIPFGVCALTMVLAPFVGTEIRQHLFRSALPKFESVIQQLESGKIPVTVEFNRVLQSEDGIGYSVSALRTNDVLYVEFLAGGSFLLKHSGYLYTSSGDVMRGSVMDLRWPRRRMEQPGWYRISD